MKPLITCHECEEVLRSRSSYVHDDGRTYCYSCLLIVYERESAEQEAREQEGEDE